MQYFVYILYSEKNNKYYVGSCGDLTVRLAQHNSGCKISTKSGVPWKMMYKEEVETQLSARRRELDIKKKKSRKYIEWLISSTG